MHDLDRTLLEFDIGASATYGFAGPNGGNARFPGDLSEAEEMELAAELLEVRSDYEMEQFLGKLFEKVGKGVSDFARSSTGQALGGVLKSVAATALPIAARAAGTYFGGPVGMQIGGMLGDTLSSAIAGGGGAPPQQAQPFAQPQQQPFPQPQQQPFAQPQQQPFAQPQQQPYVPQQQPYAAQPSYAPQSAWPQQQGYGGNGGGYGAGGPYSGQGGGLPGSGFNPGAFGQFVQGAAQSFGQSPFAQGQPFGWQQLGNQLGQQIGPQLSQFAPQFGQGLGQQIGGPFGSQIGNLVGQMGQYYGNQMANMREVGATFGLELEGLSPQDQEFEVAKKVVQFAAEAVKTAQQTAAAAPPPAVVTNAVTVAAQKHAPGLVNAAARLGQNAGMAAAAPATGGPLLRPSNGRRPYDRQGTWVRRGNTIILRGV